MAVPFPQEQPSAEKALRLGGGTPSPPRWPQPVLTTSVQEVNPLPSFTLQWAGSPSAEPTSLLSPSPGSSLFSSPPSPESSPQISHLHRNSSPKLGFYGTQTRTNPLTHVAKLITPLARKPRFSRTGGPTAVQAHFQAIAVGTGEKPVCQP